MSRRKQPMQKSFHRAPRQGVQIIPPSTSHVNARPNFTGIISIALAFGAAIGAYYWMTRKSAGRHTHRLSPALANGETELGNNSQTRSAGKNAMRDDAGTDWNKIDDMSDASFPSSDPPSFNPGIA